MKYLALLRNPKSLVLLVHPLFRPRWVDAIDRGLMRLWLRFGGTTEKAAQSTPTAKQRAATRKICAGNLKFSEI